MFYRVTQSQMALTARDYLAKQSSELFTVQQQISSGVRIQRPADDPAGMRRSLIQKDRLERLEAQEVSIRHVRSRLEQANVHLLEASNLLTKAREIALQAPQITDESERRILAAELNGILEQMASVANATDESGFLFSGTAADSRPFPGAGNINTPSGYAGGPANTELYIAGDVSRSALMPGDEIFGAVSRQPLVITGTTGATRGFGTDTASGEKQLTVGHTLTTYVGGSGIQRGTSSGPLDTVLGPTGRHVIEVRDTSGNGSSGTLSLNGGTPVNFTNTNTDLMVTGPSGEKVYVRTTSITPGFQGVVNIFASGTLSLDGGLTTVPITYQTNQQVMDSRDGTVANINTVGIKQTGVDDLEFPGSSDIFGTLRGLRDDLLNTRNLETSAMNESLNRRLSEVENFQSHLLDVVGVHSVSLEQIDRLEARTGDLKLAERIEYSDTVSADLAAAVLRLQELNNLQQFTMAAVGQLLTPNLLNFIQ